MHARSVVQASLPKPGGAADNSSFDPSLSANGKHIAFTSRSKLLPRDTNTYSDIYERDLANGHLMLASTATNGAISKYGNSHSPSISADGQYVAFVSRAVDLARGGIKPLFSEPPRQDVYIHYRDFGVTRRVTDALPVPGFGQFSKYDSHYPIISGDGKAIVFNSGSTALYPEPSRVADLYLYHNPVVAIPYYDPGDRLDLF
jgi:Tol biopolymer transport system component